MKIRRGSGPVRQAEVWDQWPADWGAAGATFPRPFLVEFRDVDDSKDGASGGNPVAVEPFPIDPELAQEFRIVHADAEERRRLQEAGYQMDDAEA